MVSAVADVPRLMDFASWHPCCERNERADERKSDELQKALGPREFGPERQMLNACQAGKNALITKLVPDSGGLSAAMAWGVSNFCNPYEILVRGAVDDVGAAHKALPINSKFSAQVTWADGNVNACSVTVLSSPVMTANGTACRFSAYVRQQPNKPAVSKSSDELTGKELGEILNR